MATTTGSDKHPSHRNTAEYGRQRMLQEVSGIIVIIFTVIFITSYVVSSQTVSHGREELREDLMRKAELSAALVDGNIHKKLSHPKQQTSKEYQDAIRLLGTIRQNDTEIYYIYTMILKNGEVFFVLDPTGEQEKRPDGSSAKSNIMDPYTTPTIAMLTAFKTGNTTVDLKPYSDDWGTFISAFAPIRDSKGNAVAILGVDLDAGRYESILKPYEDVRNAIIAKSTVLAAICAFIIGILRMATYYFCYWLRKILIQ